MRDPARGLVHAGIVHLMLMALSAVPAAAQMPLTVEVRGGGVYSTPFARGIAVVPAELEAVARDLEVGPRPAPVAELVLAARPGLRSCWSCVRVRASPM